MQLWTLLIPILSALLYRAGGMDQWKWCPLRQGLWRSFIGIPIALIYMMLLNSLLPLLGIVTYFFQPPYGEKSYLNFLGEWGKFFTCGLVLGLSSYPAILQLALLQALVSGISFIIIKHLDDKDIIKNPWVELGRGFFSTLLLVRL